ncbi:coatomer subunit beta'-2-like protein [Tanacetum coccineum]
MGRSGGLDIGSSVMLSLWMLFLTVLMRLMIQTRAKLLRIAIELALSLEKLTNEKLLNLHEKAIFLVRRLKLSEYVAQLRRIGKGHGKTSSGTEIEVNVAATSLLQMKQELDVTQTEADKAPKNQSRKAFATSRVIAGTVDMFRHVYNYDTRDKVKVFEAHTDSIRCVVVHPTVV